MTILAVGCSFLCYRSEVRPQCVVMAEKLEMKLDNISIPGNGNTHILYNTITSILENPTKYKLILIGWSNPARWDFVTAPHKWFAIKMSKYLNETGKRINIDLSLFRHWAPEVILLASWLRSKNLPFIMWNSLECWKDGESALHKEILNTPEFYKPTVCHLTDLRQKGMWISEEDHHPNQLSHNEWADELINFYRKLYT